MTVSGSGRTREKDTRAPARGPFCVWGSSLAGEEGVLLQAACSPSGSCLSVWMPAAWRICGKTWEISPPLSVPPHGRATARACILCADRVSLALHGNAACATHMPVLIDRPYSFLTYAAGVPAPLFPLGSHAGGSQQIYRAGQPGGISLFLMSFCILYERILRGVGEFEGARGSFLAQGKVPLAPSILSSRHPLTFAAPLCHDLPAGGLSWHGRPVPVRHPFMFQQSEVHHEVAGKGPGRRLSGKNGSRGPGAAFAGPRAPWIVRSGAACHCRACP